MARGRVYKSTGSWYDLKTETGEMIQARLVGKLKIDADITSTNPIAVGDYVSYVLEEKQGDEQAVIKSIEDRENYIVRVAPQNRHKKHILSANLDQAIVIATIKQPRTSTGFIDRFLVTAEAYHIPAIIIINKCDLLKEKDQRVLEAWFKMYELAGYPVFAISAVSELPLDLITVLKNRTTLVCGHSGVGKSTFLNQLLPHANLKTEIISDYSGKGQHTTTFAAMYDLPEGGCIIDTPGVKELGLIDMEADELSHYFPEMRSVLHHCKFNDCTHTNEPECAVVQSVINGACDEERYFNYVKMLEQLKEKK